MRQVDPEGLDFEYVVFRDRERVEGPFLRRDDAVLAVFDLSGWTGDYTVRFCDDHEIFLKGLE